MSTNVFTIAAGTAFAETLAHGVIARTGGAGDPLALADATIFLPTRRSARNLSEAFARVLGGAALLPQIRPLGDADDDEFAFDPAGEDMALAPSIAPVRQRLLMATLVQRWDRAKHGGRLTFAQAASLARGLGDFFDEVETQEADLSHLDALAPASLAAHWAEVKEFLEFMRDGWPKLLVAESRTAPAPRRNATLAALAERLVKNPPAGPVIAAGTTGSIPATARLLGAIAQLPRGAVVLPGLDRVLDDESWSKLDPGHPQYGMKQLLARIGVAREDVKDWTPHTPANAARETLLRETLRPAPTTDAWRDIADRGSGEIAAGLDGLSLLEAAHPGEEAAAVALMLREALETPGCTAALVTPDRNLARRVAAEMGRWNIAIDDSAGRPLANTPAGAFLALVAEAAIERFAPVPLLALLKHPLAAGGEAAADFRRKTRELDRFCLRGPRPDPGLDGIANAIATAIREAREKPHEKTVAALAPWFATIAATLAPLAYVLEADDVSIANVAAVHAAAAEALSATDLEPGATRLWRGDAGTAAATLIAALEEESAGLPTIEPSSYPVLYRALAEERAVRPAYGLHPRLAILGTQEARLQSFDVLVLGGLNEGAWPRAAAADPWLSRPMRSQLGLEPPERAIGLSAHDFATLAAGPRVILTRALKSEGSPTTPSRWLQRLLQLTKGLKLDAKLRGGTRYDALASALALPDTVTRIGRPEPRPPIESRPRSLSVTQIETWLRDPYAIYARMILKLRPLDPLDAPIGPLERGTAIHTILERFLRENANALPTDAETRLIAIARAVFRETAIPKAALALWWPRFLRAAHWFIGIERARRANIRQSFVEIEGQRTFKGPAGDFTLRCRADRIDILTSGGGSIVDYKTGEPPTKKQVRILLAPQLPLEGAILAEGGFQEIGKLAPSELLYIRFGGGDDPGDVRDVSDDASALVEKAEQQLIGRIAYFDDADTPYLPRVKPFRAEIAGDYDHLARVREWSLTGWEPEE
ncbi:MAG: double-strand break repair protein AddB [Rhizomicrobium sp.]|jgi:ATP-dependent helicase/nuclease subunit B